ncbi:MAG TPA: hypothetical protein VF120_04670 [Ktedonobacterales bacterium]
MDDRDETTEKTIREHEMAIGSAVVLERVQLPILLSALQARGYEVIGPVLRDGAIAYDKIADVDDLPIGWTDEQGAGRYRVRRRDDALTLRCEQAIRNYDPCISCATHFLRLEVDRGELG